MIPVPKFNNNVEYETETNTPNRYKRQQKDLKEGVVVNSFFKNSNSVCVDDFTTSVLIPENASLPKELDKPKSKDKFVQSTFFPLILTPVVALGAGLILTKCCCSSIKNKLKYPHLEELPPIPINLNLNEGHEFAIYNAIRNPSTTNILGALGVYAFSAATFTIANCVEALKEIWVKKREADIQKSLQEKLIAVETRSFSGKYQIIRNMLYTKSQELKSVVANNQAFDNSAFSDNVFKGFIPKSVSFRSKPKDVSNDKTKTGLFVFAGIASLAVSSIFTVLMLKHIKGIGKDINEYKSKVIEKYDKILANTKKDDIEKIKDGLIDVFTDLNLPEDQIREKLTQINTDKATVDKITQEIKNKFSIAHISMGTPHKSSFYAYVNDITGHLYNFLMNRNQVTQTLFLALAGTSAVGYIGAKSVEAVKEVQVKKANAETEYELHNRLVEVELKNFMAKKNSIINPLIQEFREYAKENPNDKEKLEKMYNNILEEIKNGPPFVYS